MSTDNEPTTAPLIELTIAERLLLRVLLPQMGTRRAMIVTEAIEQLIGFNAAETALFGIRYADNGDVFYEPGHQQTFGFPFDAEQLALIRLAISQADEQGIITREMLPLLMKLDNH